MSSIIKVDTIQDQDGNNIINENANTITIGKSGDTVTVASGATFVGGGIDWQSTIVTGTTLSAVAGKGYWIDTTSNACTVTLPASASVGDQIIFTDYARTWATNNLTINTNSLNYQGNTSPNPVYNTVGESVHIVYSGATQGWIPVDDGAVALETPQNYSVDFLVIAGGASGGGEAGGGGAAGGYRTSTQTVDGGTTITVTVGDGGAGVVGSNSGNDGSDSSISGSGLTTITSAGGGAGGFYNADGLSGGSGGGGGGKTGNSTGGSGNTPSTSPSQGNNGGIGVQNPGRKGGGGGGAGAVGANAATNAGNGGNGTASSITGSSVTRAGGGGGGTNNAGDNQGFGGSGGGGDGGHFSGGPISGTANTGGGGGGLGSNPYSSGSGGKGVVILSMDDGSYSGTTTGSPTVATGVSGKTVLTFTGSGSYTA